MMEMDIYRSEPNRPVSQCHRPSFFITDASPSAPKLLAARVCSSVWQYCIYADVS